MQCDEDPVWCVTLWMCFTGPSQFFSARVQKSLLFGLSTNYFVELLNSVCEMCIFEDSTELSFRNRSKRTSFVRTLRFIRLLMRAWRLLAPFDCSVECTKIRNASASSACEQRESGISNSCICSSSFTPFHVVDDKASFGTGIQN